MAPFVVEKNQNVPFWQVFAALTHSVTPDVTRLTPQMARHPKVELIFGSHFEAFETQFPVYFFASFFVTFVFSLPN